MTISLDAEGNISKITAVGEKETAGLGLDAIEKFNSEGFAKFEGIALAEADFTTLDMVTGSTVTSKAVIEAAQAAQSAAKQ